MSVSLCVSVCDRSFEFHGVYNEFHGGCVVGCRVDVWWVGDSVNVGTAVLSWTIVLALDGLNIGSFDGGILG